MDSYRQDALKRAHRTGFHGVTAVALLVLAGALFAVPASAATTSSIRLIANAKRFTDAQGQVWKPAGSQIVGGQRVWILRYPNNTASPRLYGRVALGARGLRLKIPSDGRYGITLFTINPSLKAPSGDARFDVYRGRKRVLADVHVPRGTKGFSQPMHSSFEALLRRGRLALSFRARKGRPAIAAVQITRLGDLSMGPLRSVLSDDFDGPAGALPDASRWRVGEGYGWGPVGYKELQTYTKRPENLALDGQGNLVFTARRGPYLNSSGKPVFVDAKGETGNFTSARIESEAAIALTHVRIRARIKVPAGRGLWPALFAIGARPATWPAGGELDIMEMMGQHPNELHVFTHGQDKKGPRGATHNESVYKASAPLSSQFHMFETRTLPGIAEFFLDGRRFGSLAKADITSSGEWPLEKQFNLVLQLAVGGWPGPPNDTTPFPAPMTISSLQVDG